MANIEKPIWSADGQTLTNVLVNNKNTTYNKVSNWYDGTPMDDSKLDDDFVYVKYEGEYLVRNMEEGQVLQKDTMDDMRNLSTFETLLLKMGIYKHVQLNGYYEKGDTPEPINYRLSDTDDEDDSGEIIETSEGIKLKHKFNDYVNIKYYGVFPDIDQDVSDQIEFVLRKYNVNLPSGKYSMSIEIPSGRSLKSVGDVTIHGAREAYPVIILNDATHLKNVNIDGEIEEGVYSGEGIQIRGDSGKTTYIEGIHIKNILGTDLEKGAGNGIICKSGNYYVDIRRVHVYNIASDMSSGTFPTASRGIFISTILGGVVDNCVFKDIGDLGEINNMDDNEGIIVQTSREEEGYWEDSNVTISNCKFINSKQRGIKLQASKCRVVNNYIETIYSENNFKPSAGISNFGNNNIITGNTIKMPNSSGINDAGINTIISNNTISIDPENQYNNISIAGIYLYTATSGTSGAETVSEECLVIGNIVFSQRSIYMTSANNINLKSNKLNGQILIAGQKKNNIWVQDNIINIPEVYSNTFAISLTSTQNQETSNIFIKNNTMKRCSWGVNISGGGTLDENIFIFDNLFVSNTAGTVRNLIEDSTSKNNLFISNNEKDIYKITNSSNQIDADDLVINSQNTLVRSESSSSLMNSPRVGYWVIETSKISPTDYLQIAIKTNENNASNLETPEIAYRIFSELRGISSGFSPWFFVMMEERLRKESMIIAEEAPAVSSFNGSTSLFWWFNFDKDIILQPNITKGSITIKCENTGLEDIEVSVLNGVFPNGESSFHLLGNSKRILRITAIDYDGDRMCYVEE